MVDSFYGSFYFNKSLPPSCGRRVRLGKFCEFFFKLLKGNYFCTSEILLKVSKESLGKG